MKYTILILILIVMVALYFINFAQSNIKEHFETNTTVSIKTSNDKYLMVCADKSLCTTNDSKLKATFTVLKFNNNIIALQYNSRYIAACFGDNCNDNIMVNSYNPYAATAKLSIVKNTTDPTYKITFYDGTYMGIGISNNVIRTNDKKKSIDIYIQNEK
jgi:hypothetical protein